MTTSVDIGAAQGGDVNSEYRRLVRELAGGIKKRRCNANYGAALFFGFFLCRRGRIVAAKPQHLAAAFALCKNHTHAMPLPRRAQRAAMRPRLSLSQQYGKISRIIMLIMGAEALIFDSSCRNI